MINLRKLLHSYLKKIHPRVYYRKAPKDAKFPYLVWDITQMTPDGEGFEPATIDVDGWDMNDDTTALETLMDNVNSALDKKTLSNDKLSVTFYLDRKLPLGDDNPDIQRRKYVYEARLFRR